MNAFYMLNLESGWTGSSLPVYEAVFLQMGPLLPSPCTVLLSSFLYCSCSNSAFFSASSNLILPLKITPCPSSPSFFPCNPAIFPLPPYILLHPQSISFPSILLLKLRLSFSIPSFSFCSVLLLCSFYLSLLRLSFLFSLSPFLPSIFLCSIILPLLRTLSPFNLPPFALTVFYVSSFAHCPVSLFLFNPSPFPPSIFLRSIILRLLRPLSPFFLLP